METHKVYKRTMAKEDSLNEDPCHRYMTENSLREPEILRCLVEASKAKLKGREMVMMSPPLEGQFLALLAKMMGFKKAIEVGAFTGYNVLNLALVMPDDGKIVCCDVSDDYLNIGKPFFKEANVEHKIDIKIQPAVQTLDELLAAGEGGTYDFVFIDADKVNYDKYYERALQLVRVGGIIAVDNVFGFAGVWDEERRNKSQEVAAIHELNLKIHKDKRVQISMVPFGDGVTLAYKL